MNRPILCACGRAFPVSADQSGDLVACPFCGRTREPPAADDPPPQGRFRNPHLRRFPLWAWMAIVALVAAPFAAWGLSHAIRNWGDEPKEASLWRMNVGAETDIWGVGTAATASRDGRRLVTWTTFRDSDRKTGEEHYAIWDLTTGARLSRWRSDFEPYDFELSDDGTRLLVVGSTGSEKSLEAVMFDTSDGTELHRFTPDDRFLDFGRVSVELSADGRTAWVCADGGLVRLDPTGRWSRHRAAAPSSLCAVCRKTGRVAAQDEDGDVELFADVAAFSAGKADRRLPIPRETNACRLEYVDGTLFVEAVGKWMDGDHHILVLEAGSPKAAAYATGVKGDKGVEALVFSPDGRYAAGIVDDAPWMFDLAAMCPIPVAKTMMGRWLPTSATVDGLLVGVIRSDLPVQFYDAAVEWRVYGPNLPVGRGAPAPPALFIPPAARIATVDAG